MVTEDQFETFLASPPSLLARTPTHRFRLGRGRALLCTFWDPLGRLAEIAKLRLKDVGLKVGTLLVMGKGGKDRKERRMPIALRAGMPERVLQVVGCRKDGGHLLPHTWGPRTPRSSAGRRVRPIA